MQKKFSKFPQKVNILHHVEKGTRQNSRHSIWQSLSAELIPKKNSTRNCPKVGLKIRLKSELEDSTKTSPKTVQIIIPYIKFLQFWYTLYKNDHQKRKRKLSEDSVRNTVKQKSPPVVAAGKGTETAKASPAAGSSTGWHRTAERNKEGKGLPVETDINHAIQERPQVEKREVDTVERRKHQVKGVEEVFGFSLHLHRAHRGYFSAWPPRPSVSSRMSQDSGYLSHTWTLIRFFFFLLLFSSPLFLLPSLVLQFFATFQFSFMLCAYLRPFHLLLFPCPFSLSCFFNPWNFFLRRHTRTISDWRHLVISYTFLASGHVGTGVDLRGEGSIQGSSTEYKVLTLIRNEHVRKKPSQVYWKRLGLI